jgi:hypothetical protein
VNRRSFLALAGTGLGAATAGCAGIVGGATTLPEPTVRERDGGPGKTLVWEQEGRRLVSVGLEQRDELGSTTAPLPLRVSVVHPGQGREGPGTQVRRLALELKAPPTADVPSEVLFETPSGPSWAPFSVETTDDRWSRISASGLDTLGKGRIPLDFLLRSRGGPHEAVGLRVDLKLATDGPGGPFRAQAETSFEPAVVDSP